MDLAFRSIFQLHCNESKPCLTVWNKDTKNFRAWTVNAALNLRLFPTTTPRQNVCWKAINKMLLYNRPTKLYSTGAHTWKCVKETRAG